MNTMANITPTPAFASLGVSVELPRRFAPGVGLVLAVLVSTALWAGLAQIAIALVG